MPTHEQWNKQMRSILVTTLFVCISNAVIAAPFPGSNPLGGSEPLLLAHHKPGHRGGPPWARRGDRDDYRDYQRRDDYRDYGRSRSQGYGGYDRGGRARAEQERQRAEQTRRVDEERRRMEEERRRAEEGRRRRY